MKRERGLAVRFSWERPFSMWEFLRVFNVLHKSREKMQRVKVGGEQDCDWLILFCPIKGCHAIASFWGLLNQFRERYTREEVAFCVETCQ